MKKLTLFCSFLLLISLSSKSQNRQFQPEKVQMKPIVRAATMVVSENQDHFRPQLFNLEAPVPGGNSYRSWLLARKLEIEIKYREKRELSQNLEAAGLAPSSKTVAAPDPVMGVNFDGNNYFSGVPNDNDMAISNGGKLVSVINSNIFIYDAPNATHLTDLTLNAFSPGLGDPLDKFDPKVNYDPVEDRFVMVFLNGFTDSTSAIIVGFSQSNDPAGAWNLYMLPGNPLNDSTWTDYPMIAFTENEFFITVNLLKQGQPWQTGFAQSLIWQIDKGDGYAGDTLDTQLWTGVGYGGKPIRNLCPIQGGGSLKGPNIYFLSDRNFDASNDSVFIVEITDTIGAPGQAINIDVRKSNQAYGFPPTARQKFNQILDTNDGRILGGFIENDHIQFVGNTLDTATGFAAVYHGIIENLTTTIDVRGRILGDVSLDYGYPNISYAGTMPGDKESMITFNNSSSNTNAGCSAVFFDNNEEYSNRVTLKTGYNYINILAGVYERWGDYTGSQLKFDQPGTVWVNGSYGRNNRTSGTWIAELMPGVPVGESPELQNDDLSEEGSMLAYPNPTVDMVTLDFELPANQRVQIVLTDINGKLVKDFSGTEAKQGLNRFVFSTEPLSNGIYFLQISSEKGINLSEKIMVNR